MTPYGVLAGPLLVILSLLFWNAMELWAIRHPKKRKSSSTDAGSLVVTITADPTKALEGIAQVKASMEDLDRTLAASPMCGWVMDAAGKVAPRD